MIENERSWSSGKGDVILFSFKFDSSFVSIPATEQSESITEPQAASVDNLKRDSDAGTVTARAAAGATRAVTVAMTA